MRKTRLYLDTSVISMIDAPHAPEKEAITKEFFRIVNERNEEYELFISPMVEQELQKAPEAKRRSFTAFVKSLDHTPFQKLVKC